MESRTRQTGALASGASHPCTCGRVLPFIFACLLLDTACRRGAAPEVVLDAPEWRCDDMSDKDVEQLRSIGVDPCGRYAVVYGLRAAAVLDLQSGATRACFASRCSDGGIVAVAVGCRGEVVVREWCGTGEKRLWVAQVGIRGASRRSEIGTVLAGLGPYPMLVDDGTVVVQSKGVIELALAAGRPPLVAGDGSVFPSCVRDRWRCVGGLGGGAIVGPGERLAWQNGDILLEDLEGRKTLVARVGGEGPDQVVVDWEARATAFVKPVQGTTLEAIVVDGWGSGSAARVSVVNLDLECGMGARWGRTGLWVDIGGGGRRLAAGMLVADCGREVLAADDVSEVRFGSGGDHGCTWVCRVIVGQGGGEGCLGEARWDCADEPMVGGQRGWVLLPSGRELAVVGGEGGAVGPVERTLSVVSVDTGERRLSVTVRESLRAATFEVASHVEPSMAPMRSVPTWSAGPGVGGRDDIRSRDARQR